MDDEIRKTPTQLKKRRAVTITLALFASIMIFGLAAWILPGDNVPFVSIEKSTWREWSIGIYTGSDPLTLSPPQDVNQPVLSPSDITDISALLVADPFIIREGNAFYLFFEVWNAGSGHGDIALATSDDSLRWSYKKIVLDEPFHLSYPCVFKWNKQYYMLPETVGAGAIRLYKARDFPTEWSFVTVLVKGRFADPTPFRHDGLWWIFASKDNHTLHLFYSGKLEGPWSEHPKSPVIKDNAEKARPAGKVISFNGKLYRVTQDDKPSYGMAVRAFEITKLTKTEYSERSHIVDPILQGSGAGWNADGMHHVDPHPNGDGAWLGAVDGQRIRKTRRIVFGWGK